MRRHSSCVAIGTQTTYRDIIVALAAIAAVVACPVIPPVALAVVHVVLLLSPAVVVRVAALGDVVDAHAARGPVGGDCNTAHGRINIQSSKTGYM